MLVKSELLLLQRQDQVVFIESDLMPVLGAPHSIGILCGSHVARATLPHSLHLLLLLIRVLLLELLCDQLLDVGRLFSFCLSMLALLLGGCKRRRSLLGPFIGDGSLIGMLACHDILGFVQERRLISLLFDLVRGAMVR